LLAPLSRRLWLARTVLGESPDSGLWIRQSSPLLSVIRRHNQAWDLGDQELPAPDSGSRLALCLSRKLMRSLLFVNSLSTASFVSREIFSCKPWEGIRFLSEPFLLEILDFSRRTAESTIFKLGHLRDDASVRKAQYRSPLPDY
jgi:hypothetical protein